MTVLSRLCAGLAGLLALLALAGYALALPALTTLQAWPAAMSPLTAAGLLLLAIAAIALSYRRDRLVIAGSALAGAVGLAALTSHIAAGADRITPWLATHLARAPGAATGRTSVATALGLTLLAIALPLRRRRPLATDLGAALALLVAGTVLLGYLYGVENFDAVPIFNTMALPTALALALLAWAALTVEPRIGWASMVGSDDVGGGPIRRHFALMLLPVAVGLVLTRIAPARNLGPAVAMALLVVATVVPWVLLVLRDGYVMNALDQARRERARPI